MNNFVGHAVTGTFLFVFGTWWTFAAWLSYVRSRKNKQRYLCRCSYAVPGVNRKFSIEGMVKIISASVCIVADFSRIFRHDRSLNAESIQHHSIYAFFLLSGVVDVMYNVGFPFPPHADYAALLLAIASEGLMFHFHLQGKTLLNAQTHKLLVYTVAALGGLSHSRDVSTPKRSGVPGSSLLLPAARDVAMAARLHPLQSAARLQALER
ncbi:hypothetical protein MTO96_013386 [Rhipicephalus appendiculatus]